jgi:hypothetical protein
MDLRGGTAIYDYIITVYIDGAKFDIFDNQHVHIGPTGYIVHDNHDVPDLRRVGLQRGGSTDDHEHYVCDEYDSRTEYGPAVYPDRDSNRAR